MSGPPNPLATPRGPEGGRASEALPEGGSLKERTLRGIGWNFAGGIGQRLVQFILGILIARQLDPSDYGLMGMIAVFLTLTRALADAGLAAALIQKQDADDVDASSAFALNLIASLALAGGMAALGRPIAAFYAQPLLEPILYVMAAAPVFTAVGRVHSALLAKKLDFKTQFQATLTATTVSSLVGLFGALLGWGVWALVAQAVSLELIRSGLYWWLHRWRPVFVVSLASLREMAGFGLPLLGSSILSALTTNIYAIVIGKVYSAGEVGLFTRARSTQRLPVASLSAAVGTVSFPAFAEVQHDVPRLRRGARQALRLLAFVVFPVTVFITAAAPSLVTVLLTEKWIGCVPYLQLLCVAELLFPLAVINLNLVKARGQSRLFLSLTVLKQSIAMGILAVTFRGGVSAIILGQVAAALVSFLINCYYSGRVIDYPARRQVWDVLPYAGLSAAMGLVVYAFEFTPGAPPWLRLALQVAAAPAVYLGACWLLRLPELREIVQIARAQWARRGWMRPAPLAAVNNGSVEGA